MGLLAILEAGGACVPLEPDAPRERLARILEDAAPAVLLTQRHCETRGPRPDARGVAEDDPVSRREARASSAVADNAAYILFTSGSTGRPKGVRLAPRIGATRAWFIAALKLGTEGVCCDRPRGFDASVPELLAALVPVLGWSSHRRRRERTEVAGRVGTLQVTVLESVRRSFVSCWRTKVRREQRA